MQYRDIIAERMLDSTLLAYHASSLGDAILEDGMVRGRSSHVINGKTTEGLCLTRSFRFAKSYGIVVFGFDFQQIRTRFRVVPMADLRMPERHPHGDYRREAEEFVVADHLPLDPYLRAIWIDRKYYQDEEFYDVIRHPLFEGTFTKTNV